MHALARCAELSRSQPQCQRIVAACPGWHQPELAELPEHSEHLRSPGSGAGRWVMSGTMQRGQNAEVLEAAEARRPRGRGRWVALSMVVVLAAGAVWAWWAGVFTPASSHGPGQQGAPPPATARVTRQDLSAVTPVTATLGYAGSYTVTGRGSGTLTWLPSGGQVIRQGQVLYKTDNGSPVVLLYGSVPAWRALYEGDIG